MAKEKDKKQHMCLHKDCLKTFSRPNRLEQHMRVHTGEKPYKCDFPDCEHSYARSTHLKRHKETAHSRNTPTQSYSCDKDGCQKSFKYEQNLKRHLSVEHEKKNVYWCPQENCDQFFRKRHQLKAHIFEHKGVLPFQCHFEGCSMKYTQRSHLDRHLKTHDGYKCEVEDCSQVFRTWSLYRKHKTTEHKTGAKCSICGKTFSTKSWLRQHQKTHTPQRTVLICPREGCDRTYAEQRNLNQHIRYFHDNAGFTCDICKRVLSTKQKLQHHMPTHSPSYVGKQYPARKGIPRSGSGIAKKLSQALLTDGDKKSEGIEETVEIIDSSDNEALHVNKVTLHEVEFNFSDDNDENSANNIYDEGTIGERTGRSCEDTSHENVKNASYEILNVSSGSDIVASSEEAIPDVLHSSSEDEVRVVNKITVEALDFSFDAKMEEGKNCLDRASNVEISRDEDTSVEVINLDTSSGDADNESNDFNTKDEEETEDATEGPIQASSPRKDCALKVKHEDNLDPNQMKEVDEESVKRDANSFEPSKLNDKTANEVETSCSNVGADNKLLDGATVYTEHPAKLTVQKDANQKTNTTVVEQGISIDLTKRCLKRVNPDDSLSETGYVIQVHVPDEPSQELKTVCRTGSENAENLTDNVLPDASDPVNETQIERKAVMPPYITLNTENEEVSTATNLYKVNGSYNPEEIVVNRIDKVVKVARVEEKVKGPGTSTVDIRGQPFNTEHKQACQELSGDSKEAEQKLPTTEKTIPNDNQGGVTRTVPADPLSNTCSKANETRAKLSKRVADTIPNRENKRLCANGTYVHVGGKKSHGAIRGENVRDKLSAIIFSATK